MEHISRIGFIGAGTVGTALASRLSKADYAVEAVADVNITAARAMASLIPQCEVCETPQHVADRCGHVFITTPDDNIAAVAEKTRWRSDHAVVHCSGAASLDVLTVPSSQGAAVGSFHPCQTFASNDQAIQNLPGTTFAIEASGALLAALQGMAEALDGEWVVLQPGDKALYHAAAVLSCNYIVTLVKIATDLFAEFDVEPSRAIRVLMPLLNGTVNNLRNVGLPRCLTGPIARGDVSTIQRHLDGLTSRAPEFLSLYSELARHTIPVALAKGTVVEDTATPLNTLPASATE
jgi:predicted short-subunit dehydrogenase-like oxidoreductase (DUF2520 family)